MGVIEQNVLIRRGDGSEERTTFDVPYGDDFEERNESESITDLKPTIIGKTTFCRECGEDINEGDLVWRVSISNDNVGWRDVWVHRDPEDERNENSCYVIFRERFGHNSFFGC